MTLRTNVARIDSYALDAQVFDVGIHLTPDSMRIFIESVLTSVKSFLILIIVHLIKPQVANQQKRSKIFIPHWDNHGPL